VEFGELDRGLKLIRKDTAPGPDGVRYTDIKAMEGDMVKVVEHIDTSMGEGTLPDTWSDCLMAVLPKPAKNHTALKGYRIITMANVWIKLCEKMAIKRLTADLEESNCLPMQVGGARPRRSTTAKVEAVTHA
jgi:hypothetical protein